VQLATCTGAPVQQWWLTYPRSINPALGAIPITLLNPAAGMCLADPGNSTAGGTGLEIGTCTSAPGGQWRDL
jgi:hypothetical protein